MSRQFTRNFLIEVLLGNISGYAFAPQVFGNNPDLAADTEETVWDQGGIYTYLTANTTLYASSTDSGDTTVTLNVVGLDANYAEVTRTVTLNGQNQVALSGQMFRVFSAEVSGSTEADGDIYIAETDTLTGGVPDTASKIKTKIVQGRERSQNVMYTVPAGKSALLINSNYLSPKNEDICFFNKIKLLNGVWQVTGEFDLYQNVLVADTPGILFPEKTDIEVTAKASNAGSSASVRLTYLLVDN